MRSARSKEAPEYPKQWQQIGQGDIAKHELEQALIPITERIFGYYLVKIGSLSSQIDLKKCSVRYQFSCAPHANKRNSLCANSASLPFQNNSVDAFLLLGELDFAQDPHQIIREIDRAVTSDGRVVIAGFNPFSIAGIMKYLPINRKNLLHKGRFFTSTRIKDWLQLLDFEIVQQEHLLYSSLFMRKRLNSQSKIQKWCQTYLPWFSSMYIIVARKREIPLSPIKPKWKLKPKFSTNTASARNAHQCASQSKQ
ncbi:MAG: methyltransferase domain-containing protein [Glaciecola sp.]